MTDCPTCAERRAALLKAYQEGKIAEAVRLAAGGVLEMVGLKEREKGDDK